MSREESPADATTEAPAFIDNRDGNTLAKALSGHLAELRERDQIPTDLCVASAYFNPQGLQLLAAEVRHVPRIRLLLGVEPQPEAIQTRRSPFDPEEPEFTRKKIRADLERLEKGLRRDRDHLPFRAEDDRAVRSLLEFLRPGRVEVRRYERHFLHAKAFVLRGDERGVIVGSSNLTRAGLSTNLELNLGHYDDPLVGRVEAWYDELWEEAEPFDLAALYEELFVEYSPYLIYLKVLWELYHEELDQEEEEIGALPITSFQRHGVWRARRILETYGGVLVADGVGLGKTFTAGELIRGYRERRQRVLLICPASLRDTTWEKFLNDYQLLVECVSYEQLANEIQLGGEKRHLQNPLDDYALVVIDEAHNYRNPDAPTRAAVLRRLLAGKRRDVVLLSATPVNNSLWDLYHLLRFFMKQDARLSSRGVLSVRARFEEAMRSDPFNLNPDLLYPIIDATTVKRTRRFIKHHYQNDLIRGADGKMVPIQFPTPFASSVVYDLDDVMPGFFSRLEEVLAPPRGTPLLRMARYQPDRFLVGAPQSGQDTALVGLLRSALLKRFESSAYAFRCTVGRMAREHETFLAALELGKVVRKELLHELSASEDDDIESILEDSDEAEDADLYDAEALRAAVQNDLNLLREMESAVQPRPEVTPKVDALVEELAAIAEQADKEGIDAEEIQQKRKVLIFSHYEDTIDWVEPRLRERIESDPRLACYRGRIASVSGADSRKGVSRESAIHGFAPVSTGAIPPHDEDTYDVLICTDVLAEGMNLQQCRNIVNYDLPWNPMRLVQRHGRVDRIGSIHGEVYLRTFFPDAQLDGLLNLEGRVRQKLALAAASVGVEDAPIIDGASGDQSFAETREEIEKLRRGDASLYERGGTEGAAQTGEEYRQELRKALERQGDAVERLPWRIGSGMVKAGPDGFVFCARVADRIYLRFTPKDENEPIITEIGTCLRLLECSEDTTRHLPDSALDAAYEAWQRAREDILDAWAYETDPANLQPKVRKLNRDVAEFLRRTPPSDVELPRLESVLDAIEAPWSMREERQLRTVWEREYSSTTAKASALIEEVERIGVEPHHAPDPLPPIETDDVSLVCWMALTSAPTESAGAAL